MSYTSKFTFRLLRKRADFTHFGIQALIYENDVARDDTPWFQAHCSFYGRDGRKVRAEAIRWGKDRCNYLNI